MIELEIVWQPFELNERTQDMLLKFLLFKFDMSDF
jgi:hypothetical protein